MKSTIQADKIKRLLRGQRVENWPTLSYRIAENVPCQECNAEPGEMCDLSVAGQGAFINFEHWSRHLAGTRPDVW
jgi:hypothetical protein